MARGGQVGRGGLSTPRVTEKFRPGRQAAPSPVRKTVYSRADRAQPVPVQAPGTHSPSPSQHASESQQALSVQQALSATAREWQQPVKDELELQQPLAQQSEVQHSSGQQSRVHPSVAHVPATQHAAFD